MKHQYFFLLLVMTFFLNACATSKDLQKATSCKVWKDDFLFPPTAVDVGPTGAYWSGQCKKIWWDCKSVSVESKENSSGNKDVFLSISESEVKTDWSSENKSIGKIVGDEFQYNQKNILDKFISISPMKTDASTKTVSYRAQLHFLGAAGQVLYQYNSHCSNEQALLGALAVSAVSQLSSNNQAPK